MARRDLIERYAFYLASAMVEKDKVREATIRKLLRRNLRVIERASVEMIMPDAIIIIREKRRTVMAEYAQRRIFG